MKTRRIISAVLVLIREAHMFLITKIVSKHDSTKLMFFYHIKCFITFYFVKDTLCQSIKKNCWFVQKKSLKINKIYSIDSN